MYYRVEPNGAVLYRKSIGSEPVAFPSWEAFAKEHPEAELDLVRRFIEAALKALGRPTRLVGMFREQIWIGSTEEGESAVSVTQTLEQGYGDERELTYIISTHQPDSAEAGKTIVLEYHSETCPMMAAHFAVLALYSVQIDPALDEIAKELNFPAG
jgi:hypothetical protein